METSYAQALWKSVQNGASPKDAVAAVARVLQRQGRTELLPRIKRALLRISEREDAGKARVYVAREKDAKAAFTASGVDEADVILDESLIGGWRMESSETLIDNSFKKHLLSIYSNVTRT